MDKIKISHTEKSIPPLSKPLFIIVIKATKTSYLLREPELLPKPAPFRNKSLNRAIDRLRPLQTYNSTKYVCRQLQAVINLWVFPLSEIGLFAAAGLVGRRLC
ncbi:hypothetical protein PoB_006196100 [Plakobranchus ocellatus]|uniref:Uncharacterized protein n=1 Tax=Plakobranchus ocellatus TaxID=259542 RepID=A0AAV4CU56_9GAST|nr:hypothetical protein PoB_006196100 [Plakobranchus ocellatus]